MFEDITQMEKEIETFRKNIVASSELVKGITDLTEATKQQRDSFTVSSDTLVKKLDACILQFKADHDESLQKLKNIDAAAIEELQQSITTDMQEWISNLEKVKAAIEFCEASATQKSDEQIKAFTNEGGRLIYEMQTTISLQQTAYSEKLYQMEEIIRGYQAEVESKYKSFVQQLESTDVDQIFKEVQDLKKSIQTKFVLLLTGVGMAVLTTILSIIFK